MRSSVKINVHNVDMCLGNTAEPFANFQSTELFNANLWGSKRHKILWSHILIKI